MSTATAVRSAPPRRQTATSGFCDYADLCFQGITVGEGDTPAGYERITDKFPELKDSEEDGG